MGDGESCLCFAGSFVLLLENLKEAQLFCSFYETNMVMLMKTELFEMLILFVHRID